MLIIECPYCGPRDQSEFSNGGEAHVKRPDGSQILVIENGQNMFSFVLIQRGYIMKDGCIHMDVVNGSIV